MLKLFLLIKLLINSTFIFCILSPTKIIRQIKIEKLKTANRQFVYLNKIYKIVFLEYHIERSKFTYVVEISSLFLMRSKMLDPFGFAQGDSNISELLN